MWLIDTQTLVLREVVSPEDIHYAILSHTWEAEEVDFQEMRFQRDVAMKRKGFNKIAMTCRLAREREILYAWIDTCCIDKTSSAALSEAINSMFKWYKESFICFAYLSDLFIDNIEHHKSSTMVEFSKCRWFTRGWTLQDEISSLTGIDIEVLGNSELLPAIPVGRRMSWASKRKTSRVDDLAYCLLGIFDINMLMIYGEGTKAFFRLQEEIAKNLNDQTLFAWTAQDEPRDDRLPTNYGHCREGIRGILARSPAEFVGCRKLRSFTTYTWTDDEFSMTNKGLKMQKLLAVGPDEDYILWLKCTVSTEVGNKHELGIRLRKTEIGYVRSRAYETFMADRETFREGQLSPSTVYIQKEVTLSQALKLHTFREFSLAFQFYLPSSYEAYNIKAHPQSRWEPRGMFFLTRPHRSFTGCLEFLIKPRDWRFLIVCGQTATTGENTVVTSWATIWSDHGFSSKAQMDRVTALIEAGDKVSLEKIRNEALGPHLDRIRDIEIQRRVERKVASRSSERKEYYVRVNERPHPHRDFLLEVVLKHCQINRRFSGTNAVVLNPLTANVLRWYLGATG